MDDAKDSEVNWEITEDTKKYLDCEFRKMDENNTGYLNQDELRQCLASVGLYVGDDKLVEVRRHFDRDGNNKLSINELVDNLPAVAYHCYQGDDILAAFKLIDRSNTGFIRLPVLLRVLTMGPDGMDADTAAKYLNNLVKNYDSNGDGRFDYAEFMQIYLRDDFPLKPKET